ncbi:MAG: hypothetical protein ACKO38_13365 [Planctomycetota bacterium]
MNESNSLPTPMDQPSTPPSSVPSLALSSDERLEQLLEACRSGHQDLELPDSEPLLRAIASDSSWRGRWDASQAADGVLRRQLEDVQLPYGLEVRLRRSLGLDVPANGLDIVPSESLTAVHAESLDSETSCVTASPASNQPFRPWRTRRWFALASLSSIAVAGVCVLLLWQATQRPITPESPDKLASLGRQWAGLMGTSTGWQSEFAGLPDGRDAMTWVLGRRTRWQTLNTPCDRHTHVVEIRRGSDGVWLFSFQGSLPFLQKSLAPSCLSGSGESEVWGWSDGQFVFLLVPQNPNSRLNSWIRAPQIAVLPTSPAHVLPSQSPKSLQAECPLMSARHDFESRGRGLACVGFHGSSWALWRLVSA